MKPLIGLIVVLTVGLLASGCVRKDAYQSALDELADTQQQLHSSRANLTDAKDYIEDLKSHRVDADSQLATCERSIRDSIRENQEVGKLLKSCRSNLVETSAELDAAKNRGKNAQMKSEKARKELEAKRDKLLEQLNALQAENRDRQRMYKEMRERLDALIHAGQLDVTLKNGRLVINLPQDILFRSGSAEVGKDGRSALMQVAAVLREFADRQFQVEGYTDNVPISTHKFPSNWELSAARALSVVHILKEGGVLPKNLSAAGYGQYHPVAPNDSKSHRAQNRRIEIVVLPNLKALQSLD